MSRCCSGRRKPPRSTLFPTRRSSDLTARASSTRRSSTAFQAGGLVCGRTPPFLSDPPTKMGVRSEEHTSELQSLASPVCRLLREKKSALPLLIDVTVRKQAETELRHL